MAAAPTGAVHVALHQYNEAVALDPLPQDAMDVVELLSAEAAPIPVWLDAAKAFMYEGNIGACEGVLADALTPEVINGIRQLFNREPVFELVQLNCALAALRIEQARVTRDQSMLDMAADHVNKALAITKAEMLPHMVQGMLELARPQGSSERANKHFMAAARLLHNGRRNHAPLLAQAAVAYNAGNMARAHQLYAQVLRENPRCAPEVRLGIAACLYRSGKLQKAAGAYNRVLQLDPGNADALLGLAMIQFGSRNVQEGLNSGLQLLQRAFVADPSHPGVLCALGHFSLLRGDYQQAKQLAESALLGSDTNRLRVASHVLLGRCNHALGDFMAAQHHYVQANRLDNSHPLAHLGTAQVYLSANGEVTNVVSELEHVLNTLPGNTDALQLLGGLLSVLPGRVSATMAKHKEALTKKEDDPVLQEMAGELMAAAEPAAALAAFDRALSLRRTQQAEVRQRNAARAAKRAELEAAAAGGGVMGVSQAQALLAELGEDEAVPLVPAKLLNNTAVLKYRSGAVPEALALMKEATENMLTDGTPPAQVITLGFNMARVQEAAGHIEAARKQYEDLVTQFPNYVDCHLRLSALARAAGDMEGAREWADRATQQAGGDVDAQALLATLYLQRGENQAARDCIAKAEASDKAAKNDPYLRLTHANVVMAMLPHGRLSGLNAQDRAKHTDCIMKALGLYREVIKAQPDNIYAINGIGTCLAELGHLAAAREAFTSAITATSRTKGFVKLPEAYINMGHLGLARKQYADALRMYEHAARATSRNDVKVLTLMARTYHDSNDLLAARRVLLRGLHVAPADVKLQFNLGFIMQEYSVRVFRRKYGPGDMQRLTDFTYAYGVLQQASRVFSHLLAAGPEALAQSGLDPKRVTMHTEFCESTIPKSQGLLQEARREAQELQAKLAQENAARLLAERERALQKANLKAAEKALQDIKVAEARKALEAARAKVAELNQQRRLTALSAPDDGDGSGGEGRGKGKKRKKGPAAAAAAADEDFYVDDSVPIERVPKKNVAAELKRGGLDSDSEPEADADVEGLFGSDDEQQQQQRGDGGDDKAAGEGGVANGDGSGGVARGGGGNGGGRLRRKRASAVAGDEQMGENDAGQAPVDGLFEDDVHDGEVGEGGGQQQQQPRKRQRQQALESDEEEAAAAAGGDGDGDELDDLF